MCCNSVDYGNIFTYDPDANIKIHEMVEIALVGKAFIIAMTVLSIWYTMQEGEIFGFVTKYGDKYIPEQIQPPLYSCNVCMTFWWGSGIYWLVWRHNWVEWLIVVIVAMGINATINKLEPDK